MKRTIAEMASDVYGEGKMNVSFDMTGIDAVLDQTTLMLSIPVGRDLINREALAAAFADHPLCQQLHERAERMIRQCEIADILAQRML